MMQKKNDKFDPSPEQSRVISHRGGHLQVIACAGSGKTESISRRVAALISEGEAPESVVAFTFTEKAAAELKDRIYRRVEDIKGPEFLGRLGPMFVGTIHGYCFRMLQDHVPRFGNYDVLDEHRHAALVSRRRHELGLDKLHHQHWKSVELFLQAADVIGNELIPRQDLAGTDVGECYETYRDTLDRFRFLTFSMIIAQAVEVLQTDKAIFERVHGPLHHLIVDEYQDINPAQERLINLLAKKPVHLCVVGDDDQAIYQWRGSDVGNILKFAQRYKQVKTVKLESNRRSRPQIVACANDFAQTIPHRLDKVMKALRPATRTEIVPWLAETQEDEASVIADHIVALHDKGWQYGEMAVLFRSVRTSVPPLVMALEARGIPFDCGGRTGLFAHPEINHFGELFAWMSEFSWQDERFGESRNADLGRAVDGLADSFGIPKRERTDLQAYFEDWKRWHKKGSRRVSLVGDFYHHLNVLGVKSIDPDTARGSARLGAFARFSRVLADYESVTLRSCWVTEEDGRRVFRSGTDRGKPFWTGLANYLLHYAKESYEDFEGEEVHGLDAVSILTVHQAKGLEWPIVFLPALTNRRFPSSMAGRSQEWVLSEEVFPRSKRSRYEGGDSDERRLFYVAMTRARDILYVSSFQRITRSVGCSQYLLEVAGSVGCDPIPGRTSLPLPTKPDSAAGAGLSPLEIGFSDLADYEECGYAYRAGYVFGFEPEVVQELGYGRAIHHVLRHVAEHARRTGSVPLANEVDDLLERELYVPFANTATFSNMRRNVRFLINRYIQDWPADLMRIWATERPFEIHFDGGILSGRADVILDEENGHVNHLAIVDYKTATDEDRDDRYARQLTIYAAAGRQEGLQVDACYLHELKKSQRKAIDVAQVRTDDAISWAAARVKDISDGSYPARPQRKKCDHCDYRLVCRHSGAAD